MWRAAAAVGLILGSAVFAQEPDSFDIEPPLLTIPNRSDPSATDAQAETDTQYVDVAQLERAIERAKRSAADGAHLFRVGVISQEQVEERALRVVRLQAELANARLEHANAEAAASNSVVVNGQPANDEHTKAELARLTEAAQAAVEKFKRAELDFAEANLDRQIRLLAVGTAHKSDVARAEEKVAKLKAQSQ
jgi:multidrug resistance efflux pump